MCPSSHADVWPSVCYFPIQTKHSGPHSALRVKGLTEGSVWLMPVSQLSWVSPSIHICTPDSGYWIHSKCCTELHQPWINTQLSLAFLLLHHCSALLRAQQSCRASYRDAEGPRGEHREPAEAGKRTRFTTGLHYSPVGAQDLTPTGTHCHPVETTLPLPGSWARMQGEGSTASLMLSGYTANAAASYTHFGAVLKQGTMDLIYWDKCKISFH